MTDKKTTPEQPDIASARAVLTKAMEGVQAIADTLDGNFVAAVDIIAATKGRVIVSGMGKSGHVARKIAATMASTGTPAYFVHPGEASHGDLGMITAEDALILLSNSGETAELRDLIAYAKRFSIPLIGVVRRASSTLVEEANVALVLPEIPEASPTGAPTTSTTMMMALGDALAMAMLERRGFTREAFHVFHPGGKLGQAFTRVAELMHKGGEMPLVQPDTLMSDVLLVMTAKRFGCAGVVDAQGVLLGVVTDGDLRRKMDEELLTLHARGVMNTQPVTISAHALAAEALAIMNERSITCLFVADEAKKPQGILHIHDCLRAGIR